MPAVDTQNRTLPTPLRAGIHLVTAGVGKARRVDVVTLATLPLRGLAAVRHPRRTAEWAVQEAGELFQEATGLVDRLRGKPREELPSPEQVQEMVEQVTDPFGLPDDVAVQVQEATPGATLSHDQLPLEDYDHLTLGSLRARLPKLDAVALVQLRDYERAHANRLSVVTMLENRIAKVANTP